MNNTEYKTITQNQVQSSCGSPTGSMNVISSSPPNYAWLQSNGYCNPANYGKNGTVCWTFAPTTDSISINSGYASTGCVVISFSNLNLYSCSPSCTLVGSGINFTVTPGQCYTWCMSYSGNGGGCNFTDFCPYYQQYNSVLPIELLYFLGFNDNNKNTLNWRTATEINNAYFSIEKSSDAYSWDVIGKLSGSGNSESYKDYKFVDIEPIHGINYYRLKQVDYNGAYKYYGIIAILNDDNDVTILKRTNILGQEVGSDYIGVIFIYRSNNTIVKSYKCE